jgi:hypothetical protein
MGKITKKTGKEERKGSLWKRKMSSLTAGMRKGNKRRDYTGAPLKRG